ncbi:MAG: hypothetical protein HYX90_01155 [Chloroflexi bacterium]|nr:hypothetical protein [Chloroflexota bacterium]
MKVIRSSWRRQSKLLGIFAVLVVLLASAWPVQASSPFDNPPGLEKAIAAKERNERALLGLQGVVGVGVGGGPNGNAAIIVFAVEPGVRGIPDQLEGVQVVSQVSGRFIAFPKPNVGVDPSARFSRPVPIGVSTGHPAITAGTIGARVKDLLGNVYALSNNHVYANENRASAGDAAIQPGTYDGGTSPADDIGTLYDYQVLDFSGGSNLIDAAIVQTTVGMLGNATPSNGYGRPKSATSAAVVGMTVQKYGRTTGQTKGRVYAIHTTVNVSYDSGTATFVDQIVVTPGTFSAGGDSGSLIVVNARRSSTDRQPVGLLFAGSSSFTIANPIGPVLERFGVTIDGE